MNSSLEKVFVISIGVIIVLFLLLDGGAMTEATFNGGIESNGAGIGQSWIWIIPTLLIFGLGFLLAWIVLGKDEASQTERDPISDQSIDMLGHGNLHANGKE